MSYNKVQSIDQLRTICSQGPYEGYIQLKGHAISRKTIEYKTGHKKPWHITNHIDDSEQKLTEKEFASDEFGNIAKAVRLKAYFIDDQPSAEE